MLSALASTDTLTWFSILVKASAYATTLLAVGSVLVWFALSGLSTDGRATLRKIAAASVVVAALLSAIRLPVRASFLAGGTFEGAIDPILLGMVAESPLGLSIALRCAGLALILAILLPGRVGTWIALGGAILASASFAFRGHTLGEPRAMLGALITLHILGLAFWIGSFAPLSRAARTETPAAAGSLAHEFGTKALWVVGTLVAAGAATLVLLGAATPAALETAYGQIFVVKLAIFTAVLSLAAFNKMRLTPALLSAAPAAGDRLRRSIRIEAGLIAVILATTAALTTVTTPPREEARSAARGEIATLADYSPGGLPWRS